jgi:hypothetical protein
MRWVLGVSEWNVVSAVRACVCLDAGCAKMANLSSLRSHVCLCRNSVLDNFRSNALQHVAEIESAQNS